MQQILITLASFFVLATTGLAGHPAIQRWEHDGKTYIGRPVDAFTYCPANDLSLNIRIGVEQQTCLEDLKMQENVAKADVIKCFTVPRFKYFFDQLQLISPPNSCIKQHLEYCMNHSQEPGSFLAALKDAGYQHLFDSKDIDEACRSFIYP